MSLWGRKPKTRFSLARLRELYAALARNPVVTERNRALLVETLRELAEVLVWGDQHEPAYFDLFLEKDGLGQLRRLMQLRDTVLHIQVLQTMSILVENLAATSSLYYLLSNDRVNDIIQHPFDFSDEELMAYYISFLKTLSLKLDASTVQFFFNSDTQQFPLYTEAVKFFNHSESMVRIGVRTITLAVFKVSEPSVRAFIVSKKSAPYFSNLVWFLQSKSLELEHEVVALSTSEEDMNHKRARHRFRDAVDELTDLLYYIADIYALDVPELAAAMTENLLEQLEHSVEALESGKPSDPCVRVALYVLGQLFLVLKHAPLLHALAERLLHSPAPQQALLAALVEPESCSAAVLLLLALSRNQASSSVLLARALARQSSLLDAILSPSDSSAPAPAPDPLELPLSKALAGLLALPAAPVSAMQCAVLLLRALRGGSSGPPPEPLQPLFKRAYAAARAPLARELEASPHQALESFERGVSSYRQLTVARWAGDTPALLLPGARRGGPDAAVHRFLVLRDVQFGPRDAVLPLQPASVPLAAPGQPLVVALGPQLALWREAEPPSLSGTVEASLPLQGLEACFVRGADTSQSLPSPRLRLAAGGAAAELQFRDAAEAAEVQAALLARRHELEDGKLRQLAQLLRPEAEATDSTETE